MILLVFPSSIRCLPGVLDMDLDSISTQACFLGNWFDSWSTKSLEIQRPFLMDIKKKNEVKYQKYKFFVLADPKIELKMLERP